MKVLLVNGSVHQDGCVNRALEEVKDELENQGIQAQIFWIGHQIQGGCLGCGYCRAHGQCFKQDQVNEFVALAKQADGFVFGSAVHYAGATGDITCFLDRLFYSASKDTFRLKPAAVVVSARRSGTTSTYDQLIKYPGIAEMPIISSCYWNNVHGFTRQDVERDFEGLHSMRVLAKNMAYYLKCVEAGQKAGVKKPEMPERIKTNFIEAESMVENKM